jgi:hypothetical protein
VLKFGLVSFLTLFSLQASAESPSQKLAIVDGINFTTDGIPKTVNERDRFFTVLTKKLADNGWSVLQPIRQDSCNSSRLCLAALAEQLPVAYVLRITGEGNLKVGYTLHYQLISSATKHVQKTNTFCEICITDDVSATSAELTLGLLGDARWDDAESAQQKPPTTMTKDVVSSPVIPDQPRRATWVPWSMVGVGAIGLAYGACALYENGKTTKNVPVAFSQVSAKERYSSKTLGILGLVGGGALAAAGTLWLVLTPSGSTAAAIAPGQISLNLRY